MRSSDRFLLILLAVVSYALAVLVILSHFVGVFHALDGIITFTLYDATLETICLALFVLIALTVGTSLFVIVSRSYRYRLVNRQDSIELSRDELGVSEITFDALRAIAEKKCRSFRYVSECSCDVDVIQGSTVMYVRLRTLPDTVLTDTSREVREVLSRTIAEQTGIKVSDIRVLVLPFRQHKK